MHNCRKRSIRLGHEFQDIYADFEKAMEEVFRAENVRMIGGGTDNHLILADVFGSLGVGKRGADRAR